MDVNVQVRIINRGPPNTGDDIDEDADELRPQESNFQSSDIAASDAIDDLLRTTIASGGDMSDSSVPRHTKPRHSRPSNAQRRPAQPSTTHAPSPPVPFENTQLGVSTNFPAAIHYSTSTPPHSHGGVYIGQYTMSPQPSPMGVVHSPPPPPYAFSGSHIYHHPTVSDSSLIPQNLHVHYQSRSQHPHAGPVYQYQPHSWEGNSPLHSSFSRSGPAPIYPTHRVNALGPLTSPHPTPPSPSYIGSGLFHYPSTMSTPHYAYSPPFPGTPTYHPSQFSQHYTANRDGESQDDWYYLPRRSPGAPPQQYDAGPSYSGHYPTAYPQMRPELPYNAHSFPSASTSTPQPIPPFSQHPETLASNAVVHAASQSSDSEHLPSENPIIRQPYHPNPPPHRSEWVMWAGNIPSDATRDEIYRFFNQVPDDQAFEPTASLGVISVFLISRSNCAFINFESEKGLLEAISRFNGVPLRADDPRCARLVCRVRRKDDDLKAGVGGQRGMGMHARWVKEQKQKNQEKTQDDQSDSSKFDRGSTSPSSLSEQLDRGISLSSDNSEFDQNIHAKHSSTSDSSNSSFLARHFPKRYFILKSLTQHDLDLSVQTGFWATQKHNEGILDQSYRTSKDVYLIFGVNKSGEFYGYARMAGPVRRGGQSIHWAPSPPRSNASSSRMSSDPVFFSPGDHRLVDNSPLPVDNLHTATDRVPHNQSAPGILGMNYSLPSMKTPEMKFSLGQQQQTRPPNPQNPPSAQKDDFELDPLAPVRAMRSSGGKPSSSLQSLEEIEEKTEEAGANVQEPTISRQQEGKGEEELWGDCFKVEWISTEKVPFIRTRQFRNPWNHDREVKVSRDGTELEPTVGQRLLDEWDKLSEPQPLASEGGMGAQVGHGDSKSVESSSKRLVPHLTAVPSRSE